MSRMEMRRTVLLGMVLVAIFALTVIFQGAASAAPSPAIQTGEPDEQTLNEAIESAVAWLLATHRNADGGFSSFSGGADLAPSDVGGTMDALWALGVVGADTGPSVAYLEANADQFAEYVALDGSTAGKALLALITAGQDVSDFAGVDVALAVTSHLSPTGQFGVNTAFNQSLALMGLTITDEPVPQKAVDWLTAQQSLEGELAGSWDDGFGTAGNIDSTAMSLVALRVSGMSEEDPVVVSGLEFLERAQLDSGGWEYGAGFGENANSTAMAVWALLMWDEDILAQDGRWAKGGVNPLSALLAWQSESGAFQADFGEGRFDDFFSTVQSLPVTGFGQNLVIREQALESGEAPPVEMTPTAVPAAAEPTAVEPTVVEATATPEPVEETATPEPTEVLATNTPEAVAETESAEADAGAGDGDNSAEDDGGSILPWVIGVGGLVIVAGLAWWAISRLREA